MVEYRDIDWTPKHVDSRRGFGLIAVIVIFAVAAGIAVLFGMGILRIA